MKQTCDILIIGGGASGLFAAITAAKTAPHKRVVVLEREQRVAKKLLTTGNGRCNLSNVGGLEGHYYGDSAFAEAAFACFGVEQTCCTMAQFGIPTVALEHGKLFPCSLQASSVVDMLRYAATDFGVEIVTETTVERINAKGPYEVHTNHGVWQTNVVAVATGGKSCVGKFDGPTGYDLLQNLGYTVTKLTPAIVQVTTERDPIKPLTGIKVDGQITAVCGKESRTEVGEILFAEYGISGPPVLQLSGMVARYGRGDLTIDFMPDWSGQAIYDEIRSRCSRFASRSCEDLLTGLLNKRLGQTVLKRAGIEKLSRLGGSLTHQEVKTIVIMIKEFPLKANGTKGWSTAQVTCGGVLTKDFDPQTMVSKLHKGLYVMGEVLNVTGDCGGYNLQWAWTSGYLAGKAMGEA